MRTLMLVEAGLGRPPVGRLRELIAADLHPDVLALEDRLGADLLDEAALAAVPGPWGCLLRRLPAGLGVVIEAHRRRSSYDALFSWGERLAFPLAGLSALASLGGRRPRMPHVALLFWVSKPKKAIPLRLVQRGLDAVVLPVPRQRAVAARILSWRPGRNDCRPTASLGETSGLDDRLPLVRPGIDLRFWRPLHRPTDTVSSVGREMRDYVTLVDALAGTAIPCHVAAGATRDVDNPWLARLTAGSEPDQRLALPAGVTIGRLDYPELRELYARSRFVVVPLLPSTNGNGHTSIFEALAMGRPVIYSDIAGLEGILPEAPFLRRVPPGDAAALRVAIERWWADPAGCDALGAEARRWVERHGALGPWVDALAAAVAAAVERNDRRNRRLAAGVAQPLSVQA